MIRVPILENQTPEQVLKHIRQISALAMTAAEANTLEDVLQQIADSARGLIGARYAALGVPNGEGGLRFFKVSGITEDQMHKIDHHPVGIGLLGEIMRAREPLRLEHMHQHDKAAGFPEGHPHMESLLGMPIQIGNQLFGTLYLTDKVNEEPFSEEDEWLLELMAHSAALAIAGAQVRNQQQQIARLQERERIAMELHDNTIQSLYGVGLSLDLANRAGTINDEVIDETLNGVNRIIEEVRAYIMELRQGDSNDHCTIREEIETAVGNLHIPDALTVELDAQQTPSTLPDKVIEGVRSIVHECLSNVVRHAEANRVIIKAHEDKSHFRLIVADDGRGFDINGDDFQQGMGLQNMEKRARLYGGAVSVEAQPGHGTTVHLKVPLVRL